MIAAFVAIVLSIISSSTVTNTNEIATLERSFERNGRVVYLYTAQDDIVENIGVKSCAIRESGEWSNYPAASDKSKTSGVIFSRDNHAGYWIGNTWFVTVPKSRRFYVIADSDAVVEPLVAWVYRGVTGVNSWEMIVGASCQNRIRLPLYMRFSRSP